MLGNDYVWWFAILSLFNTELGLSNVEKNTQAEERAKRIEQKLDKLLEMLSNE